MRAGRSVGRRFGSEEDFGVANAVFLCVPVCAVLLRLSLFLCCGGIRGGTAPPRPRDDGERVAGRDNGQAARGPFLAGLSMFYLLGTGCAYLLSFCSPVPSYCFPAFSLSSVSPCSPPSKSELLSTSVTSSGVALFLAH